MLIKPHPFWNFKKLPEKFQVQVNPLEKKLDGFATCFLLEMLQTLISAAFEQE